MEPFVTTEAAASFLRGMFLIDMDCRRSIADVIHRRMSEAQPTTQGIVLPPPERGLMFANGGKRNANGTIAVLSLSGVIQQRRSEMMDWIGGTSTLEFGSVFDAVMYDPNVKGIVIDADTPGGVYSGVPELAQKIYSARGTKPMATFVNPQMCSAGLWVGAATPYVFVSPSGSLGSVGAYSVHTDMSKMDERMGAKHTIIKSSVSPYKAEFSDVAPLSPEAQQAEQANIDAIGNEFVAWMAKTRGILTAKVLNDFGQGRSMSAKDAVAAGMADRVMTFEDVLSRMASGKIPASGRALDAEFDAVPQLSVDVPVDESWRQTNAAALVQSRLRMKGII